MKRCAVWLLAACVAVAYVSPASAQSAERRARAVLAWTAWLAKHRVETSQLAVAWKGKIVERRSVNIDDDKPMNLASLSKAYTGLCVRKLVEDGTLSFETTIAEVLREAGEVALAGSAAAERNVQQLLTHTTGFKPDITQGRVHQWYRRGSAQLAATAREALEDRNQEGREGEYFYSNTNYAVLGWLVELKTGKAFLQACQQVLAGREGIDGFGAERKFLPITAFGGLQASAADYLALLSQAYGEGSEAQKKPLELPHHEVDRNLYYGPGILMRQRRGGGANFWHFGMLCMPDRADDVGSYVGIYGEQWSVAVIFDKCLTARNAMLELDNGLVRALFGR